MGILRPAGVAIHGFATKKRVCHHAEEIAQATKNRSVDQSRSASTKARDRVAGGANHCSCARSNSNPDGSSIVNQVHRFDIVAGILRSNVLHPG